MRLLLSFVVFCAAFSGAHAQSANPTATLSGTVSDQTGAVIVGARLMIRNRETGLARTFATDAAGAYRFIGLPPGEYELRAEASGFAPFTRREINLLVGQTTKLDLTLSLVGTTSEVSITAEAPAIDAGQTAISTSVDQERIEELPVVQRRFLGFALTVPGLTPTGNQTRGSASSGGAGARSLPDSGFSFGGLRARSNNVAIDGVDNNDETTGASRAELSVESIREFQVTNNDVSAEFGGSSGGSVNAVTRSGTNEYHGGFFLYHNDATLSARQPVFNSAEAAERKPALRRWVPGFDTGGPIRRGRTFFHATLEHEYERSEEAADISDAAAARINQALAAGAFPRLGARRLSAGLFPTSGDDTEGGVKINQQVGETDSLMLRYAFTNDRRRRDALGATGLTDVSARGDSYTRDHAVVGQYVWVLNQHLVNDTRFQLAHRGVVLRPNEATGPQVLIPGVVTFGRATDAPSNRGEDHYQVLDTFAVSRSRHQLRFGGAINHVRLNASLADRAGGFAVFRSVDDLLAGNADFYAQSFGDPRTRMGVTSYGVFVQDRVQALPNLTVDLGLRYDYETLPPNIHRDKNNFSPRLGFAYSPDAAHRLVIRGAYGVYFDRYLLGFLNPALQRDGVQSFEQILSGRDAAATFIATQGGPLAAPVAGVKPSIYRTDPRLATPYSQQGTFGFERQVVSDITLAVNYLFVKGTKLARTRNVNLQPPVVLTNHNAAALGISDPTPQQFGRSVFGPGRIDARYDAVYQLENSAASVYHGMTVSLGRRLTKRFGLQTSYTLSKAIDDASDFDEQPQNPHDLRGERAPSRFDQRQRFVLSGVFNLFGDDDEPGKQAGEGLFRSLLENLELAPIITLGSGRRFNPLVGTDANLSRALPLAARPLGLTRDSMLSPLQKNIDLRVLEHLPILNGRGHLNLRADFINLFNTTNVRELNPFFGPNRTPNAGFGTPLDALGARRVQLSVDFEY